MRKFSKKISPVITSLTNLSSPTPAMNFLEFNSGNKNKQNDRKCGKKSHHESQDIDVGLIKCHLQSIDGEWTQTC